MKNNVMKAVITGTGSYLPQQVITTEELIERLNLKTIITDPERLELLFTGVRERRFVADGEFASDLAFKAASVALKKANLDSRDLDVVIFASCSHDLLEPATACILQHKLGASNAHVFDVKNACNSFLNALDIAHSFIVGGKAENILIAAGETCSKSIDWNIQALSDLKTRLAGLTVGDGGGAFVVQSALNTTRGIIGTHFYSDGSHWDLALIPGGGAMYPRNLEKLYFYSKSGELVRVLKKTFPAVDAKAFAQIGLKPEQVDFFIYHQASKVVVERILKEIHVPLSKTLFTIEKFGNTAAASIPIVSVEAESLGLLKAGMMTALVSAASGFGIGHVLLEW